MARGECRPDLSYQVCTLLLRLGQGYRTASPADRLHRPLARRADGLGSAVSINREESIRGLRQLNVSASAKVKLSEEKGL